MEARSVLVQRYKKKIVIVWAVKVEEKFIICLEIGHYNPNTMTLLRIICVCYI